MAIKDGLYEGCVPTLLPLLPTSSLANDLLAVTDAVGVSTSKPIFWLAISMGGAVVSRALQMQPDAVAGVVLLAPMISLTKVCGGSVYFCAG